MATQRVYQISAELHDQMVEIMDRTIRLCANPKSSELLTPDDDATASFAGSYGYSYQGIKCLKELLECGQLIVPQTAEVPF